MSDTPPQTLEITLLGSPQVVLNGRSLHFESTKATALLAFLAMSGRSHRRAELALLLWPDSDARHARGALRYTLSLLKKEIGAPFLITTNSEIGLDPDAPWRVDAVRMRSLLAPALQPGGELTEQRLQELEAGVALYHGEFLQGFTLRDAEPFNEWAFRQADALRREQAAALQRLAYGYHKRQNWDAALRHGHHLLHANSLHEPAHCQLMQTYAAAGQWTAVHNQFQALVDLLDAELGVPPLPETTRIYRLLCRQEAARRTAPLTPAEPSFDRCSQQVLIAKMRRFWVETLLDPLRADDSWLQLRLRFQNDSVDHPWADVLEPGQPPDVMRVDDAFRVADRALLILGAPGAGKTISLIALASSLLEAAAADETQPIPVILNLGSLAVSRLPLAAWVVEELIGKYQIPRRMGRAWLAQDRLLLLLDGLDEMPAADRAASIAAINQFRQAHGLADLVVCCRQDAYAAAVEQNGVRLKLHGAVVIQPPSTAQVDARVPPALAAALRQNDALQVMTRSPLALSLLRSAFAAGEADTLPGETAVPATTHQLLHAYIRDVIERQAARRTPRCSPDRLSAHLTWLARQMQQHSQAIFLLEQLQPSWLTRRAYRWLYLLLTRCVLTAVLGTPIGWSFIQLIQRTPPAVEVRFLSRAAAHFGIYASPWNGLLSVFLLVLVTGLAAAVVDGLFFAWRQHRGDEAQVNYRIGGVQLLAVCTAVWSLATYLMSQTDTWWLAMSLGGMEVICFVLAFGYVQVGQSFQTEIRSRGALRWNGRTAWLLGGVGAAVSLLWSAIAWLQEPTSARWLFNLLLAGLTFFLLGGLSGKQPEVRNRPNEGIWIATQNGAQAALLLSLPTFLLVSLFSSPVLGLLNGLLFGLLAGVMHGLNDVTKHVVIRLLLWPDGWVPVNAIPLFDYAVDCALLRKIGGGYAFRHRLLLDHFAAGAEETSADGRSSHPG